MRTAAPESGCHASLRACRPQANGLAGSHEAIFSEAGAGYQVEKSLVASEQATAAQLAATQELVHAYNRQIDELHSKLEQVSSGAQLVDRACSAGAQHCLTSSRWACCAALPGHALTPACIELEHCCKLAQWLHSAAAAPLSAQQALTQSCMPGRR